MSTQVLTCSRVSFVARRSPIAALLLVLTLVPFMAGAAGGEHDSASQPVPTVSTDSTALAAGSRKGLPFTKKGKGIVKEENATRHDGKNQCELCGVETVPGKQHKKDVTPPGNETQVDHVIPKAAGGRGDPDNGQVLCRDCNLEKSDKLPQTPEGAGK